MNSMAGKTLTLKSGASVIYSPLPAYPDGLEMAAELASLAMSAASGVPPAIFESIKDMSLSMQDGNPAAAGDAARQLAAVFTADPAGDGQASTVAAALFQSIGRTLLAASGDGTLRRAGARLLSCLTVQSNGRMVPMTSAAAIQEVAGFDVRLLLELLQLSIRENMTRFFSGSGATAGATEPASKAT